jgi:hypothetical protein
MDNGFYTEYPELGIVAYEDNNGNVLALKCDYVNNEAVIGLDNAEKLAKWSIKNGNMQGYNLLESVTQARMKYNCKVGE